MNALQEIKLFKGLKLYPTKEFHKMRDGIGKPSDIKDLYITILDFNDTMIEFKSSLNPYEIHWGTPEMVHRFFAPPTKIDFKIVNKRRFKHPQTS